jgi:uncharacterized protein (TIGR04141 family)
LDHYRAEFTWVDNITLVEAEVKNRQLRGKLVDLLVAEPDSTSVDAILPDDLLDVEDDRSISVVVFPHERRDSHGRRTLTVASLARLVAKPEDAASRDRVLDADIRFLDDAGELIGTASVLECISAELTVDDMLYIAYNGDFYSVHDRYIERITRELEEIPVSEIEFPPYRNETEPEYNARVRDECADTFIHLDAKPVRIPGETTFEACDLVRATGALIHVKRKGRSSTLSHLFMQAANSCELLRRSPEAQELFQKLLAEHSRSPQLLARVQALIAEATQNRREMEVVFVFLGDWKGRSITSLPLFSRVSLVNEARRVRGLGYRLTVKTLSYRRDD